MQAEVKITQDVLNAVFVARLTALGLVSTGRSPDCGEVTRCVFKPLRAWRGRSGPSNTLLTVVITAQSLHLSPASG